MLLQGTPTDQPPPDPAILDELVANMNLPDLLLFAVVVAVVAIVLFVARRAIDKTDKAQQFGSQLTMLTLTLIGIGAIVLALPIQDNLIQAILSLIGIVVSAVIALSATTFMGNAMAGFMLRSLKNFKAGDFIRCGDHFGRVTERGLVHTEIQTEDSDLTTLPNLFLVTNPLTTIRSSGTIVSATVSLGYDVQRSSVELALMEAAEKTSLTDPFVQIQELGDHSVTYRVAGFSGEVKRILTMRSRLRAAMMDALHAAGIEIVSPTFMNQRRVENEVIPETQETDGVDRQAANRYVFDKADAAETHEFLISQRKALQSEIDELETRIKEAPSPEEKESLKHRKESKEQRRDRFDEVIEQHERVRKND